MEHLAHDQVRSAPTLILLKAGPEKAGFSSSEFLKNTDSISRLQPFHAAIIISSYQPNERSNAFSGHKPCGQLALLS